MKDVNTIKLAILLSNTLHHFCLNCEPYGVLSCRNKMQQGRGDYYKGRVLFLGHSFSYNN